MSVHVPGDYHVEVAHLPSAGKGKEQSVSMGFCWLVCLFSGQTIGHGIYTYGKLN